MADKRRFVIALEGVHCEDTDMEFRKIVLGLVSQLKTAGYKVDSCAADWSSKEVREREFVRRMAANPKISEPHREAGEAAVERARKVKPEGTQAAPARPPKPAKVERKELA
jgi:hypothetical protein